MFLKYFFELNLCGKDRRGVTPVRSSWNLGLDCGNLGSPTSTTRRFTIPVLDNKRHQMTIPLLWPETNHSMRFPQIRPSLTNTPLWVLRCAYSLHHSRFSSLHRFSKGINTCLLVGPWVVILILGLLWLLFLSEPNMNLSWEIRKIWWVFKTFS